MTTVDMPDTGNPAEFETRGIPRDLDAERVVSASAMARPELIDELAAEFDPADFSDDAYRWVWYAIEEIRTGLTSGEIRYHAVERQLQAWRADGTLPIIPPTALQLAQLYDHAQPGAAAFYAAKITKAAVAARIVKLGHDARTRGTSFAFDPDTDIAALQAQLDGIVRPENANRTRLIGDLWAGALTAAITPPTNADRIPTGFIDLDSLLSGGWAPGQLVVVGARPAIGKALALDTPLATPLGWTTMGDVQVGDFVLGADGKPAKVTFATEVQHDRQCFEVTFSDGSVIVADAEHLWLTDTRASLRSAQQAATGYNRHKNQKTFPAVRTTAEIAASLRCVKTADQRLNHSIANPAPLNLPEADLPVDPYVLGLWLGDGATDAGRISTADPEILDSLRLAGYEVRKVAGDNYDYGVLGLVPGLRAAGVFGNKHVPQQYLRASEEQRRALLAGLLDTDGTARPDGVLQFAVTKQQLAEDFRELVSSLGYRSSLSTKRVNGRTESSSTCYTITFTTGDKVFRLTRKLSRLKATSHARAGRRYITDVRPVPSVPVRCIQVDNADHLYLAGRTMIPTHNTTLATGFARAAAIHNGIPTLFDSLEMGEDELAKTILSAEARIALHHIKQGIADDAAIARAATITDKILAAPLHIDDNPDLTLPRLRAQVRHLTRTANLRLVIVDYLQLMTAPKAENRQGEVAKLSRGLKLLAKEFGVTVIILAQLNRGPEHRQDKRPSKSDLRESGAIEQDADIVILLHREDAYDKESPRSGEADLIVDKHRGGPTGSITAAAQLHYARFVDLAQT